MRKTSERGGIRDMIKSTASICDCDTELETKHPLSDNVHHHLRCFVRLDQERQLEATLGRRAQGRPLKRSGLHTDILHWDRELELKGADEGEEKSLESVVKD